MWNRKAWLSCSLLLALLIRMPSAAAQAPNSDSILLSRGQEEFSKRQFSEALRTFRIYLRTHPDDQDTWTRFAATYYHTGQAKQALVYLRKSRPSNALKGFNQFYQALSYDALGDKAQAQRMLARLMKTEDPLAEDAAFERAANRFEDGEINEAKASAEEYLKRFRNGRYREACEQMLRQLPLAGKVEVPESQRARYRLSYFEHHPLSLLPFPHLWYYQIGYSYVRGSRSNPAYSRGEPTIETGIGYEQYKLLSSAGITVGPFHSKGAQSFLGYSYTQDWLSDGDRMQIYAADPADIQYFPFRPDLMERSHRIFAESSSRKGDVTYGAYAHWEAKRSGSLLFPAPERPEIRKAFDVSSSTLFVPWVQWMYIPNHHIRGFLLTEKMHNKEQKDFSFKSYNFGASSEDPFLSLSVQEISEWPSLKLKSTFELFRWRYLYNDFWESYESLGAANLTEYMGWQNFRLTAHLNFIQNRYTYDIIKNGPCGDIPVNNQEGTQTSLCPRMDQKLRLGGSFSYINNKQQAFTALFDYRELTNPTQKVYNEAALDVLFVFTHTFPNFNSTARYIEPYRGLTGSRGAFR